MKAIETIYNGLRFRSRLEARWAVFFDSAGIRYEYEPEGFELEDGTRYLPDFYLPDLDVYAEVKADTPDSEKDLERAKQFIVWGGKIKVLIILSTIPGECDGGMWHFPCFYWRSHHVSTGWWFFYDGAHCVDGNVSGAPYLQPFPTWKKDYVYSPAAVSDNKLRRESWASKAYQHKTDDDADPEMDKWFQLDLNKRTFAAFDAARQARFEHGEHG